MTESPHPALRADLPGGRGGEWAPAPTRRCAPTSPAGGEVNRPQPPTRRCAPTSPASGEVNLALEPAFFFCDSGGFGAVVGV